MCIQCTLNVYSIYNIHSMLNNIPVAYANWLTYLLSYPKSRDAIASKKTIIAEKDQEGQSVPKIFGNWQNPKLTVFR